MRSLLAAVLLPLAGCLHAPYEPDRASLRALHDSVAIDGGEARFHAIPFPPRARTRPTRRPLVVVEPVLFRRDLLLEDGGLVASFEDAGYPVWLVGADAAAPPPGPAYELGIARAIGSVARASGVDRVDVLSLGISAPATLDAVFELDEPGSAVHIGKLAFLGAPLDLAYPGAFAARSRVLAEERVAGWVAFNPPPEADDSLPARARYPRLPLATGVAVLFVAGKVDGVAPTESSFPVFAAWGSQVGGGVAAGKRFFVAGLENGFARDYDALALLERAEGASRVWDHLIAFFSE